MNDRRAAPPALQRLQQVMAGSIRRHGSSANGFREALAWIAVPSGEDPRHRLAVYTDGYPARMHEALREAFPAIAHIVGGAGFAGLVGRYCNAVDIPAANLNVIGEQLPRFLRSDPDTTRLPFLPDLATLEWLAQRAFHATHEATIDPAAIHSASAAGWESVRLQFQPSVGVVRSAWPVHDLWQARNTPRNEIELDLIDRPQSVIVHRDGLAVHGDLADFGESVLLEALLAGEGLGTALEFVSPEPARVSGWFASWMAAGRITRIESGDP